MTQQQEMVMTQEGQGTMTRTKAQKRAAVNEGSGAKVKNQGAVKNAKIKNQTAAKNQGAARPANAMQQNKGAAAKGSAGGRK